MGTLQHGTYQNNLEGLNCAWYSGCLLLVVVVRFDFKYFKYYFGNSRSLEKKFKFNLRIKLFNIVSLNKFEDLKNIFLKSL